MVFVEPSKSALPNPNLHYYKKLMGLQVPVLFFNSSYPGLNLPCVSLNDALVGEKTAEYLIRAGHKEIGKFFKSDDDQGHLRYSGFAKSMEKAGLTLEGKRILWIDSESLKDMELWADYLFRRLEGCTGGAAIMMRRQTCCLESASKEESAYWRTYCGGIQQRFLL